MSVTKALLASSIQPQGSPDTIKPQIDELDTEMTCPLTLDDKEFSRSRSASPTNDDMSYHGRDRSHTTGYTGNNQNMGQSYLTGNQSGIFDSNNPWRTNNGGYNGQGSGFSPDNSSAGYIPTPYDPYDPSTPLINGVPGINRYRSNSTMPMSTMPSISETTPLSSVVPGSVWPSENQLSVAHSYGIRNEDGSYTRLIRADDIDRFAGYNTPHFQGPQGLIILPPTRVPSPNSRLGPEQYVPRHVTNQLPPNRPKRPSAMGDVMQMQIDTIISSANPRSPPRREKIYCDKWIHEGVCAFTQMGCKYKHIMPTDKLTQVSLGLNHGFPNWFRRANRDICDGAPGLPALVAAPNSPENSGSRGMSDNWRGGAKSGSDSGGNNNNNRAKATSQTPQNGVALGRTYGPIAPPQGQSSRNTRFNSLDPLKNERMKEGGEDDEEEDVITYKGRNNIGR